MILPDYWLPRPPMPRDPSTRADFDRLYDEMIAHPQQPIDYRLTAPKWQFLCYLADERNLALHGSTRAGITRFEPRQADDLGEFGNQLAIYAAADGIWPMFFAILDRTYPMSLCNGSMRVALSPTERSDPYYFFSVSQQFLDFQPWREGVIYILPRDSFVVEPPGQIGDLEVHSMQLASLTPVDTLASLVVTPQDFPFLDQIRGHDDARLSDYADALLGGLSWPT